MRDMLEARKRGDFAFRDKEFKTAIDCYSQVQFRTTYGNKIMKLLGSLINELSANECI